MRGFLEHRIEATSAGRLNPYWLGFMGLATRHSRCGQSGRLLCLSAKARGLFGLSHDATPIESLLAKLEHELIHENRLATETVPDGSLVGGARRVARANNHFS